MYTDKCMNHFRNPRNVGTIKDPDGVGKVGNPVKFRTFGCGAAIATSSMVTELAKGKTIEEALRITRGDVAEALEGLPPIKMHCSNLAADALHAAIEDYYKRKGIKIEPRKSASEDHAHAEEA